MRTDATTIEPISPHRRRRMLAALVGIAVVLGIGALFSQAGAAPPPATFNWSMPDRFGLDANGDHVIDEIGMSTPQGYVRPTSWRVDFNACDANGQPHPGAQYVWTFGDDTAASEPSTSCSTSHTYAQIDVPYSVNLTVTANGESATSTQTIVPRDYVVVSLGDSAASGEGNPDWLEPKLASLSFDSAGFEHRWNNERCHRSALAGPAQAALRMEQRDPHSSVTFVHLACSGARITRGILRPNHGIEPPDKRMDCDDPNFANPNRSGQTFYIAYPHPDFDAPNPNDPRCLPSQIDQLTAILGNRPIDAITVSGGINDVFFSKVAFACLLTDDCSTMPSSEMLGPDGSSQTAEQFLGVRFDQMQDRYDVLTDVLAGLPLRTANPAAGVNAGRVYFTTYPNAETRDDGSVCRSDELARVAGEPTWLRNEVKEHIAKAGEYVNAGVMSEQEWGWAAQAIVGRLTTEIRTAVTAANAEHGDRFEVIDEMSSLFTGHGYCARDAWMRDIPGSFLYQRDPEGSFHPNRAGHFYGMALPIEDHIAPDLGITAPELAPHVPGDIEAFEAINQDLAPLLDVLSRVDFVEELEKLLPDDVRKKRDKDKDRDLELSKLPEYIRQAVGSLRTKLIEEGTPKALSELDAWLDDIDGANGTADDGHLGPLVLDLQGDITPHSSTERYELNLTFKVTGPLTEMRFDTGGLRLDGPDVTAEATIDLRIIIEPGRSHDRVYLLPADDNELRVTLKANQTVPPGSPTEALLGVVDVMIHGPATGPAVDFQSSWVATPRDPNGDGEITTDELVGRAFSGAFTASCDATASHLTMDLHLQAGLPGLMGEIASLAIDDTNLCDGLDTPTVDFADPNFEAIQNLGPVEVLDSIIALARALETVQARGDLDLPFADGAVSDAIEMAGRIKQFLVEDGYTNPDDPLAPTPMDEERSRGLSLQEIIAGLEEELGLQPGALGLHYQPDTKRFAFDVSYDASVTGAAVTADADILARAGVQAEVGTAALTVDASASVDLGVALDVSADPAGTTTENLRTVSDRLLIRTQGAGLTLNASASVLLNADARIGVLPLDVTIDNGSGGAQSLLAPIDPAQPMLRIGLTSPQPYASIADILSGDPARFGVTANVNARLLPVTARAVARLSEGGPELAHGSMTVSWNNLAVLTGADGPQVAVDGDFNRDLLRFAEANDPLEMIGMILGGVRDTADGVVATARENEELARSLPVIGTGYDDIVATFDGVSDAADPLCLFDFAGHIEAYLQVKGRLGPFTSTKDIVPPYVFLDYDSQQDPNRCTPGSGGTGGGTIPPPPILGTLNQGTLSLYFGTWADLRDGRQNDTPADSAERVKVTDHGDGSVLVEWGQESQLFGSPTNPVTYVSGNFGIGDDQISIQRVVADDVANPRPPAYLYIYLGAGADTAIGGDGNDTFIGDDGDDIFVGNAGNDVLNGLAGNDHFDGGDGNDTALGYAGDDVFDMGNGDDTVSQHHGLDVVLMGPGSDRVDGYVSGDSNLPGAQSGPDVIDGGTGQDVLVGSADGDLIIGGRELEGLPEVTDFLWGRTGDDCLIGDDDAVPVLEELQGATCLGNAAFTGPGGKDALHGEAGNDALIGQGGDDQLTGAAGDDLLDAGDGVGGDTVEQRLDGGDGNDRLVAGAGEDDLDGGAGNDVLSAGDGKDQLTGGLGNDTLFAGGGDQQEIFGGDGDDLIDAGPGHNTASNAGISGGRGNDIINGSDGDDFVLGQEDSDVVNGDAGNDKLYGDSTSQAAATDGSDTISGGPGDDLVKANGGNDVIESGDGADIVNGNEGDDTIDAGPGDDATVSGDAGNDNVDGGDGNDAVRGGAGNDIVLGGAGSDRVHGEAGADSVDGGAGNDAVVGDVVTLTDLTPATFPNGALRLKPQFDLTVASTDVLVGGGGEDFLYDVELTPPSEVSTSSLTMTVTDPFDHGTNTTSPTSVQYTPATGYQGSDLFGFRLNRTNATGPLYGTGTATVTYLTNRPPVAVDDELSTDQGEPVSGNVLTNDTDPDGDVLAATALDTATEHGHVVLSTDGTFTYTPDVTFAGPSDGFDYVVTDGLGGSDTGHVTITIVPDETAPLVTCLGPTGWSANEVTVNCVATDGDTGLAVPAQATFSLTTAMGAGNEGAAPLDPPAVCDRAGNCADLSPIEVLVDRKGPQVSSINDGVTYPAGTSNIVADVTCTDGGSGIAEGGCPSGQALDSTRGAHSFTVTATDTVGNTSTATFHYVVANAVPVVTGETYHTNQGLAVSGSVLGNDTDADGDALSATALDVDTGHGHVVLAADGTFTYTPSVFFAGPTDGFDYQVVDGFGGTATGHVTITFVADTTPPVVTCTAPTGWSADEVAVPCVASDADTGLSMPSQASFTLTTAIGAGNEGPVTLNPPAVCDRAGNCTDLPSFEVLVDRKAPQVSSTNDGVAYPAGTTNIVADVTCIDGGSGIADGGCSGAGQELDHTRGNHSFTVTATDSVGNTSSATFTYSVLNGVPAAMADNVTTNQGVAVSGSVLANDSDPDGDPLAVTPVDAATAHGHVIVIADGTFTYTPDITFAGPTDGFDYEVADGFGGTATAHVTITIVADTTAPNVTCPAPNGWSASEVTVNCTATDGGTGLAVPSQGSFSLTTAIGAGNEGVAQLDPPAVCDRAGNCTDLPAFGVSVDRKGPQVTSTNDGVTYPAGTTTITADVVCTDAGSGVAADGCPGAGQVLDASPGMHTFTVTATDAVGNTTTRLFTYSVSAQGLPVVNVGDVTVPEGNSGLALGHIPVTLSAPVNTPVSVRVTVTSLTATIGSDAQAVPPTIVTFPAGTTTQYVSVLVRGDTTREANERLRVTLDAPSGATIGRATGAVIIHDDDPARGGARASVGDVTIVEGQAGTRKVHVPVTLSEPVWNRTVTVYVWIEPNTATVVGANRDAEPLFIAVPFAPGQLSTYVEVTINSDQTVEPDEALTVRAVSLNIAMGKSAGTIRILNDD